MRDMMSEPNEAELDSNLGDDSGGPSSESDNSDNDDGENKETHKIEEVTLDEKSRQALGEIPFLKCENEITLNKDLIERWK